MVSSVAGFRSIIPTLVRIRLPEPVLLKVRLPVLVVMLLAPTPSMAKAAVVSTSKEVASISTVWPVAVTRKVPAVELTVTPAVLLAVRTKPSSPVMFKAPVLVDQVEAALPVMVSESEVPATIWLAPVMSTSAKASPILMSSAPVPPVPILMVLKTYKLLPLRISQISLNLAKATISSTLNEIVFNPFFFLFFCRCLEIYNSQLTIIFSDTVNTTCDTPLITIESAFLHNNIIYII